jgi:hypothetical protein
MTSSNKTNPPSPFPLRWVQFAISDWKRALQGLNLVERGLLVSIAALQADHEGPFSIDEARLARICGATTGQVSRALDALEEEGLIERHGSALSMPLMQAAIDHAHARAAANSAAAKAGHGKKQKNQSNAPALGARMNDDRTAKERKDSKKDKENKENFLPEREKVLAPTGIANADDFPSGLTATAENGTDEVAIAVAAYGRAAERHGWPVLQRVTKKRRADLSAVLSDVGGLAGWDDALRLAEQSDFITGRGLRKMRGFSLTWLSNPDNICKVFEGNYANERHLSSGRTLDSDPDSRGGLLGAFLKQAGPD